MKKFKFELKHLIALVSFILIILIGYLLGEALNDKTLTSTKDKYSMSIRVDATKEDDTISQHQIDLSFDGSIAKIDTSFLGTTAYIKEGKIIYKEAGRYKYVEKEKNYLNIYDTLSKIDLGTSILKTEDTNNYNPIVNKDIINEILACLGITKTTKRDENAIVVLNGRTLQSFSIYLIDIENYKGINISISYEELENDFSIETPVLYENVMDKVDNTVFDILT